MPSPERHARRLRLVAGSEEAARGAVLRLEDALRCASLPDAGARLLLVRRLALGRLPRQASSQTIARVIEARFADSAVVWTDGAGADAAAAEHVVFRSAWHARIALTRRLLQGRGCTAWYWPLAVAEFRVGASAGDNLRAIARAVARTGEAAVALPAWALHATQGGGARRLAAMVPPALGDALLRESGLKRREAAPGVVAAGLGPSEFRLPPWLECLLRAAAGASNAGQRPPASTASPTGPVAPAAPDPPPAAAVAAGTAPVPAVDTPSARRGARPLPGARGRRLARSPDASALISASLPAPAPGEPGASPGRVMITRSRARSTSACCDAVPTACGGLLFLLPVLARLGLPRWAEAASADPADWTCAVLAAALERLDAPVDDPMWQLVARAAPPCRIEADAPAVWRNLLAAPRGAPSLPLVQALTTAASASAQAGLWLTAVRRWLRRGAHIGLASLVLRPGRLSLTPTHVDVHFRLAAIDLRVRRIGLDIDPGWLPWFGRVVAYHYRDASASSS